jgi:hypothetical protein
MNNTDIFFNINEIQRIFDIIQEFPDGSSTIEKMSATVPLFNKNKVLIGRLVTTSTISKFNDSEIYNILINSTIFFKHGDIITYTFATKSKNKIIEQTPGTILVCKILESTINNLSNDSKLIINYINNEGDAIINII